MIVAYTAKKEGALRKSHKILQCNGLATSFFVKFCARHRCKDKIVHFCCKFCAHIKPEALLAFHFFVFYCLLYICKYYVLCTDGIDLTNNLLFYMYSMFHTILPTFYLAAMKI